MTSHHDTFSIIKIFESHARDICVFVSRCAAAQDPPPRDFYDWFRRGGSGVGAAPPPGTPCCEGVQEDGIEGAISNTCLEGGASGGCAAPPQGLLVAKVFKRMVSKEQS